jgi:hypothetical protein
VLRWRPAFIYIGFTKVELVTDPGQEQEPVTVSLSRAELFKRGAQGGAALAVAGGVFGAAAAAASADPISGQDMAYVRLLVGAELLASDFYAQAVASSQATGSAARYLKRAYMNEQEHYQSVAGILSGAFVTPAVSGDFDFSYPTGTFDTPAAIFAEAAKIETLVRGSYLGASGGMQTAQFKTGLAQIAACEAQHASYFSTKTGGKAFWLSFPPALTIQQASDAMAGYTA